VPIFPQAIVAMGETADQLTHALRGVRALLAFYGSTPAYRPVLEVEGWADVQTELHALSKTGHVQAMVDLVDEAMARTLAVVGTPAECAAEIHRRFGDVAERVCTYFPGYDVPLDQVTALATALQAARFP
jgi:alkanesulfonate monooxygenase SsuD/methylene tetrahydromethanopterin reductase-like flavin-dependent oxidoreductase (luciferase family)